MSELLDCTYRTRTQIKKEAVLAIQTERKDFMRSLFEDMVLLMAHAMRVTIASNDLERAIRLRGMNGI